MENVVNEKLLKKRSNLARIASYVGFGSLFMGVLAAGNMMWLAYLLLLIGLIAASVGSFLANTYVREPRADKVLGEALENLDKRFVLYNYYFSVSHLLLSHYGLMVLSPYAQEGEISFDGKRWRHKAGVRKLKQLIGDPSLGQPHKELAREVASVKKWIDENVPEEDIPVNGIVVFLDPDVQLTMADNSVRAVKAADLPKLLKEDFKSAPVLSTSMQRQLRQMLDDAVAAD